MYSISYHIASILVLLFILNYYARLYESLTMPGWDPVPALSKSYSSNIKNSIYHRTEYETIHRCTIEAIGVRRFPPIASPLLHYRHLKRRQKPPSKARD